MTTPETKVQSETPSWKGNLIMEKCENCKRIIRGDVYWTADEYPLCEECWGHFADLNLGDKDAE